jgi:cob(I)alamin adenosyltransferase
MAILQSLKRSFWEGIGMTKIYTKTGDQGDTRCRGASFKKSSSLIEAIGTIDELNSAIGVSLSHTKSIPHKDLLTWLQTQCFELGAILALDPKNLKDNNLGAWEAKTQQLEHMIDVLEANLPQLNNFIYPGGSPAAAYMHMARTICRKLERQLVELCTLYYYMKPLLPFINRMSDYMFVLARTINTQTERIYKPN